MAKTKKLKEPDAFQRLDKIKIICTKCLKVVDTSKRLDMSFSGKYSSPMVWITTECHGDKRILIMDSDDLGKEEIFWSDFSQSDYVKTESIHYGYDNTLKKYVKSLKIESELNLKLSNFISEAINLGVNKVYYI